MSEVSLGIDIGGTKIAAGLITKEGALLRRKTYPTPTESKESILIVLQKIIIDFTKQAEAAGNKLVGVGVGSAGQVQHKKGLILSGTANLKDWNNIHIVEVLQEVTNLPIWLDNDANTFAIAEFLFGEARGTKDLIGLTLGTGVGGGVITNGKMLQGKWGGAGELGHLTVNMNGPGCNCGSRGCIEVYASGTGIANRMKEKGRYLTSKEVFSLYEAGDLVAIEVIEQAMNALIYGIINLIHTFNPSVIVLGGGVVQGRSWLAELLQAGIQEKGMVSLIKPVSIFVSNLGKDAGVIGAASLSWFHK